jgi:hypothetical protein
MAVEYTKTKYDNISTWKDLRAKNNPTMYRYDVTHKGNRYLGSYLTLEDCKKALLKCCIHNNIPIKNYKRI